MNTEQNIRTETAVVTSVAMNKTVVAVVERKVKHPIYGKYIRRSSKRYVHDEDNKCRVGDTIEIKQTRPISKMKKWVLLKVISNSD